jgi:hypothetical protein
MSGSFIDVGDDDGRAFAGESCAVAACAEARR